jgi:hypothetical protein
MRMIALVADGAGRLRLHVVRSPDLWRRAVAVETGSAHLLAVALAPPGVSPGAVVARLAATLGGVPATDGAHTLATDATRARAALARAVAGPPASARLMRALARLARRVLRLARAAAGARA